MKGIILGINLHDYKSNLKQNDLVCIDGIFYNLESIDPRFLKNPGEPDNSFMYLVKSKTNQEIMNFERSEISKAHIAMFDSEAYFNENKKIKIGDISPEDLTNIKYKHLLEWNLDREQFSSINMCDLIELTFEGSILEKQYTSNNPDDFPVLVKYFKLA